MPETRQSRHPQQPQRQHMLRKGGWGGDETVTAPAAATEAAYVACRASRSQASAYLYAAQRDEAATSPAAARATVCRAWNMMKAAYAASTCMQHRGACVACVEKRMQRMHQRSVCSVCKRMLRALVCSTGQFQRVHSVGSAV